MDNIILNQINQILLAKLLPSEYREYWKKWNKKFKNRHADVFGTDEKGKPRYRIYLPIDNLIFNDSTDTYTLPDYIDSFNLFCIENTDPEFVNDSTNCNYFIKTTIKLKYNRLSTLFNLKNVIKYIYYDIYSNNKIDDTQIEIQANNFKSNYDKLIYPFLSTFLKITETSFLDGYIKNKKGQDMKIIAFVKKIQYLLTKFIDVDNKIINTLIECLNEGIKNYNKFSATLVDKNKKDQKYELVISRHPYDIAGMSTDRGWTSCMRLPNETLGRKAGINYHYIMYDVEEGTLVCYLIKAEDHNIEHPMGRILVKPYVEDTFIQTQKEKYKYDFESYANNIITIFNDFCHMLEYNYEMQSIYHTSLSGLNLLRYCDLKYTETTITQLAGMVPPKYDIMFCFKRQDGMPAGFTTQSLYNISRNVTDAISTIEYKIQNNEIQTILNKDVENTYTILARIKNIITQINKFIDDNLNNGFIELDPSTYKDKIFFVPEAASYGTFPDKAKETLNVWLDNTLNKDVHGVFIKNKKLYPDGSPNKIDK